MTKQDMNSIIERVWTQQLQRVESIPQDLANKYSLWLQGVIKQAAPLLQNAGQPAQQGAGGQAQGQPQQEQQTA